VRACGGGRGALLHTLSVALLDRVLQAMRRVGIQALQVLDVYVL
jgi:hypothetical protein